MEIKLKAKYKNNVRAKHLLKLMKMVNSIEQSRQTEAVKVFLMNLVAAGPVDVIPIPKNVADDISESMFEVIRLKSSLFDEAVKTGKMVTLADYFDAPDTWQIPRKRPAPARESDEGLGEIYNQVYEKIEKKLRHAEFKIHSCVPFGYRGFESLVDVVDITVDTKEKIAKVKCKDGNIIEFGYDPDGRFNDWAYGAKVWTPEEAEFFKERQTIRDKLLKDNKAGKITDKEFDAAMDKDRKICDKELRRRWKEIQEKKISRSLRTPELGGS